MISQYLSRQAHSFLMRHNSSPYTCIKEVIIIFFVHKSFTQICVKGFTLRRREAFLHEMDITVRRGSSLYPWETENPFIGWARKPDWRKWIIGNRSVPAVIMLQRRCRTLPQRWDGMGWARGASFSLVSLTSFHIVNTVILSSLPHSLSDPPTPPLPHLSLLFSFCLFFMRTLAIRPKHTQSAVESFWLTFILLRCAAMSRPCVEWLLK